MALTLGIDVRLRGEGCTEAGGGMELNAVTVFAATVIVPAQSTIGIATPAAVRTLQDRWYGVGNP
jgi:hypothetical protein